MTPRTLDQFYTRSDIAQKCFDRLSDKLTIWGRSVDFWVEPSAGTGAFYSIMPFPKKGLDIEPLAKGIEKGNFLEWQPETNSQNIITLGNPPFGKNASLAVAFFNHAASFSDVIAFILPRTFEKPGFTRRLNKFFHLEDSLVLPLNSFIFNGLSYNVPCVFQIWCKAKYKREETILPLTHPDFTFVSRDDADFSFQRVGVLAGTVREDFRDRASASHYFIKALSTEHDVAAVLRGINWGFIKSRTAGNPSISKTELIEMYDLAIKKAV